MPYKNIEKNREYSRSHYEKNRFFKTLTMINAIAEKLKS